MISAEDEKLLSTIAPELINRFNSKEGYEVFADAFDLVRDLATARRRSAAPKTVVGLITNSDDRVPDVLSSLGFRVNTRRLGEPDLQTAIEPPDIDFTLMSYDVGHEKPHRRMFDAAKEMLASSRDLDLDEWNFLYVGDELEKDAFGAMDAGWDAVLVDRDSRYDAKVSPAEKKNLLSSLPQMLIADRKVSVIRDFNPLRVILGI